MGPPRRSNGVGFGVAAQHCPYRSELIEFTAFEELALVAAQSYRTTSGDKKTKGHVAFPPRANCSLEEGGVRCRRSCAS